VRGNEDTSACRKNLSWRKGGGTEVIMDYSRLVMERGENASFGGRGGVVGRRVREKR